MADVVERTELDSAVEALLAADFESTAGLWSAAVTDHGASALLDRIVAHRNTEAANALTRIEAVAAKDAAKAVRRHLHRLRGSGVAPTVRAPVAVVDKPAREVRPLAAHVGAYDRFGSRNIVLVYDEGPRGVDELLLVVDHQRGIRDCAARNTTLRRVAEHVAEMRDEFGASLHEVPVDYAVGLFAEGLATAAAGGYGLPTELVARPWVISHAASHPFVEAAIYQHVTPGSVMLTPELLGQSIRLFDEAEIEPWLIDIPDIERFLLEYMRAVDAVISTGADDHGSRRRGVIESAVTVSFTDDVRRVVKRLLEETALILWMTGRERPARMAVAVAMGVASAPSRGSRSARGGLIIPGRSAGAGSTDSLEGIPFVCALVEATIVGHTDAMVRALTQGAPDSSDE